MQLGYYGDSVSLIVRDDGYIELGSEHGRSFVELDCPICDAAVTTTKWSLAGSGKLCQNCKSLGDDTLLTGLHAHIRFKGKNAKADAKKRMAELKQQGIK